MLTVGSVRTFTTDPAGHQALERSSLDGKTLLLERQDGKVIIRPTGTKISAEDRQSLSRALDAIREFEPADIKEPVGAR